jgi:ABC-type uncharacterized transport system substrate-binding protein
LALLGGAVAWPVIWPLVASAQQAPVPVIGFLHGGPAEFNARFLDAFRSGLREQGFTEGRNVTIEYRWAGGQLDRLPDMAADLVRRRVAVIATPLSTQAALAAKAATTTIPIVFGTGGDPVAMGLAKTFSRPGGNATGVAFMTAELALKRMGVMHELLPTATHFAVLVKTGNPMSDATIKDLTESAGVPGATLEVVYADSNEEIDAAFAKLAQSRVNALLIAPDEFFTGRIPQLAALSTRYGIPSNYVTREFPEAGGLSSYGPDRLNAYREVGIYTGRVLKGANPAELPVEQPTKFELVINVRTAEALEPTGVTRNAVTAVWRYA